MIPPPPPTGTTLPHAAIPPEDTTFRQTLWEWSKSLLVAVVVWLFLRTFLVEAFRIPSGSMEKTLLVGDFLFVNKAIYGAQIPFTSAHLPTFREPVRGDVLVFDSVEDEGLKVVKRLIGVAGDTLAMHGGMLFRNGQQVDEPYVQHDNIAKSETPDFREKMRRWQVRHLVAGDSTTYAPDLQEWGPIVVPRDSLFMMGDNRDLSYDGRYWGFLPRLNVRGTPLLIYYSYDPSSWKVLPVFTAVRLNRIFSHPH